MRLSGRILSTTCRTILYLVFACPAFLQLHAQIISPTEKSLTPSGRDSMPKPAQWPQDTVVLHEAIIRPYKNYESFKQAFISLETDKQLKNSMIRKGQLMRKQLEMSSNPDMDALSNFRNRYTYSLIRSNGFVLFSTEPGKGVPIISFIRKIKNIK
jgi:hypothetical protein